MNAAAPASIDVVIPVYNAAADLARCVDSVLAHTGGAYRLVLIDDASPDPAIRAYFDELRARALTPRLPRFPSLLLLANETNLGFTGTANRGMLLARDRGVDVVLLNSDTAVTAGWLDAMVRCAASDPRIGTVTPFSNNAELCSFPRFCEDNPWPDGADAEPVRAALACAAVPSYPDLPTGVGFCFLIRRALIEEIGTFDPAFGLGYGEENEFCMRAIAAGWRNALADDAFVLHFGGRSFAGRKADLGVRNMALLLARHPQYLDWVRAYIGADPLKPVREAAATQLRVLTGPARGVLHLIHGHGGGTEHHVRALIDASRSHYRHYLAIAVGDRWQVEEHLDDGGVKSFDLVRLPGEPWTRFLAGLAGTFGIDLIHLHNISGCREGLLDALPELGVPYGYTVHDLNFACPTITFHRPDGSFCGLETDEVACRACLAAQPEGDGIDIVRYRARHRALLARAAFLIAPSRWAAATLERYFPDHAVEVIAHGAPGVWASLTSVEDLPAAAPAVASVGPPKGIALPDDGRPTVAILGAIGPDKGSRRLEKMVDLVRAQNAPLRFVLIGYLDREHGPWQSDDAVLTIHGRYAARDLPELLAHYRVRLVAYPSAGPETFSFTLSESWAAGLPVVAPPVGALDERIAGTGAGWVWTEAEWASEVRMLARIVDILAPANAAARDAAASRARAVPQPTLAAMAGRTLALYDAVPARGVALGLAPGVASGVAPAVASAVAPGVPPGLARSAVRPSLAPQRVRDALGYRPWTVPVANARLEVPAAAPAAALSPVATAAAAAAVTGGPARGLGTGIARMALRWRHTLPGRLLYSLTPSQVVDALKARLR